MAPLDVIGWLWIGFCIVWLCAALTAKRRLRRQSAGSRSLESGLLVAAYILLDGRLSIGILGLRVLPRTLDVQWLGLALTAVGFALAFWARYILGRNWSGVVSISENHELVSSGPYAYVRNPIYSGILLAILGTAVGFGRLSGFIAFLLSAISFLHKSRIEEGFLMQEFGEKFNLYRQRVKALIPFVL
jgi:protein-S-isoprenylcysteine O-methyltransferase Ste14